MDNGRYYYPAYIPHNMTPNTALRPMFASQNPEIMPSQALYAETANMKILVKCYYGDWIQVIECGEDLDLDGLKAVLCECFKLKDVSIKYTDDEGDSISIQTEPGLKAAFSYFIQTRTNTMLKLFLTGESLSTEDSSDDEITLQPPQEWVEGDVLGVGSFGKVILGLNTSNGQMMAIKKIVLNPDVEEDPSQVMELEKEIKFLSRLNHPNIVFYMGCQINFEECMLNIFLEYVPGGSLYALYSSFGPLNERLIKIFTEQILYGLVYLHKHGIVHRDIKSANILVNSDAVIKLTDFGTAKKIETCGSIAQTSFNDIYCKTFVGTPYWMAPEVITGNEYKTECDIWSVGCTIIELATGKFPWDGLEPFQVLYKVGSGEKPDLPPDIVSEECEEFTKLCMVVDQNDRPTANDLIKEDFITNPLSVYDISDAEQDLLNAILDYRDIEPVNKVVPEQNTGSKKRQKRERPDKDKKPERERKPQRIKRKNYKEKSNRGSSPPRYSSIC
eukprot:TRINITY_DN1040_c0_g1_i1.p1 TRINITY_DN1040_c0_g1~~TRINITY_DN1040_c0_g1_i1.p1  ORF type:complete len:502 (+),score=105.65 TRINITY_DN1040_c0_g1_i1:1-1506(+)